MWLGVTAVRGKHEEFPEVTVCNSLVITATIVHRFCTFGSHWIVRTATSLTRLENKVCSNLCFIPSLILCFQTNYKKNLSWESVNFYECAARYFTLLCGVGANTLIKTHNERKTTPHFVSELTDCIQRHKGCFIWFWLYSSKNASDESAFPWEEKCPDLHPMTYALMQKWKMQSNEREASVSLSITAKYAMRGRSSLLSHWMFTWGKLEGSPIKHNGSLEILLCFHRLTDHTAHVWMLELLMLDHSHPISCITLVMSVDVWT